MRIINEFNNKMTTVIIGGIELYFSYDQIIGIDCKDGLYVCENIWSQTTGRHLNSIEPDKSKRMLYKDFMVKVAEVEAL